MSRHRDLGYEKQGLFYMQLQGKMNEHFGAIRNDLIHSGFVTDATVSSSPILQLAATPAILTGQAKIRHKKC
jgi:putative ABC transport system permease protein